LKILVTGTAGFIGFHLAKKLLERGDEVVGLDNINDYYDVNLKYARLNELGIIGSSTLVVRENQLIQSSSYPKHKFIKVNLEDSSAINKLFETQNFDAVMNLAAQAGVRYSIENPHAYIQSNIVGFMNILEACRNYGVKNLAYASSSSVYGLNKEQPFKTTDKTDTPISLYAATKKSNELMAHTYSHLYGIKTTGLRFFTVYGPWGRPDMAPMLFADAITNNRAIKVFNHGKMSRDFTYIDDIVDGIIKVIDSRRHSKTQPRHSKLDLESNYNIYNIGNNTPLSFMEIKMTNIILCGGSGTRLWPISRTLMPKQFVKLFDEKSLFQLTVERNSKVCDSQFIVSNTEQYFLALDQLEELGQEIPNQVWNDRARYLLEPVGRNTAPAIALACMKLDKEEIVLVTPSDHLIKDEIEYKKVLAQAQLLASEDNLVTFGIKPTFAETGFGYIEANGLDVKAFHEKPDAQKAQDYVDAGNYYWNSGMFCFKAGVFLEELQKYSPTIYEACQGALHVDKSRHSELDLESKMTRIKHDDMLKIPEDSIDYAVMEKSKLVKVVPSDIDWSDVGSFDALFEELPKDENNNTINDKHISIDSKNNLIHGVDKHIATIDVEDLIIVDTGDAILVSKKGSSQKVKQVVQKIKQTTQLHNIHLTGHRPWGTYTILEDSNGYKIKRIEVKPNKRLSLQRHKHRNEHWIVVSGTAVVTINDKTFTLNENESTYIKAGDIHRLLNDTKELLVIIEAQVGSYTGEDDIERLEDDYNR